jgi:hypothetical protein
MVIGNRKWGMRAALGALTAVLASLVLIAAPSSTASAAGCPAGTHIIYSGHYTGCEMNGQQHADVRWAGQGAGTRTLAVVGVGYAAYYAVNNGPFQRLDNGVAGTRGGGIFFVPTVVADNGEGPLFGHFRVLGSDNVTRYCIDFEAGTSAPVSRWYEC